MWAKWVFLLILLIACQNADILTGDVVLEMEGSSDSSSELLFVEQEDVKDERLEFAKKLGRAGKDKRSLYEEYVDVIGANGILDGIKELWPNCHSEAHDIGKVIFARLGDVGQSLRVCADSCHTGCMHGVLMEALSGVNASDAEGHIDPEALKPFMDEICLKNEQMVSDYLPGECSHGVGHALAFLSGYDISEAIGGCNEFNNSGMKYYCASGVYMEYVAVRDKEDKKTRSLFYPCDTYDYPAACAWHKVPYVSSRLYKAGKKLPEIVQECEKLDGKFRLGCFHGLGNAHAGLITRGKLDIKDLCLHGSEAEQVLCIEGSVERMARYYENKTREVCEKQLDGKHEEICLTAVKNKMNNINKNLTLYLE